MDRKLKYQCKHEEDIKMQKLSLINFEQIFFDPIANVFLTPELIGVINQCDI